MDMRKAMSIWIKTAGVANPNQLSPRFPTLAHLPQRHYDAIGVGGGVFGTTVAYKLKEAGKKVALIEGRTIGLSKEGSRRVEVQGIMTRLP